MLGCFVIIKVFFSSSQFYLRTPGEEADVPESQQLLESVTSLLLRHSISILPLTLAWRSQVRTGSSQSHASPLIFPGSCLSTLLFLDQDAFSSGSFLAPIDLLCNEWLRRTYLWTRDSQGRTPYGVWFCSTKCHLVDFSGHWEVWHR